VVVLHFNKKQDGPLLEMFESPLFSSHMLIMYLFKLKKANLIEYLVNKLYRERRHDSHFLDFYLPQICYLAITKSDLGCSIPLQRFVL
jgi:hypothetical protein